MIFWGAAIVAVVVILALLDREIYFYEGTHLGTRIQSWLYDRWAARYDRGKQASQAEDDQFLTQPLLHALKDTPHPLVLDLATGTGRLPLALLSAPQFKGRVIAMDISAGMLARAAEKLAPYSERVTLIQYINLPLPFADHTFDMVTCVEAFEVMPEMQPSLNELMRVLRPGGLLVSSRATEASGRTLKVLSVEKFKEIIEKTGFIDVEVTRWWKLFDRVLARKPGGFTPAGDLHLVDVLRCRSCGELRLSQVTGGQLRCQGCGASLPIQPGDIVRLDS